MAPPGHLERQLPRVVLFAVEIERIEMTAKFHQDFPEADRRSVAEHLARSRRDEVRAVAARIREH
jgi:predicted FMN-binding regulatory protein PaiB